MDLNMILVALQPPVVQGLMRVWDLIFHVYGLGVYG